MRRAFTCLLCLLVLACSGRSMDSGVPPVDDRADPPRSLAWWSRAAMDAWLGLSVRRGERSGYVVMFARDGVPVYANAWGWADIETRLPMEIGTAMRVASMTKPVTAVAAMQLVERGTIALDDPVSDYLPAFAALRVATASSPDERGRFPTVPLDQPLRVRHLLTFTAGIGPGRDEASPLWEHWKANAPRDLPAGTLGERIDHLAALPLFEQPGTRWRYGWSADVLARIVEVASGQSLDAYFRQNIFAPLGMTRTRFRFTAPASEVLATVYRRDASGEPVPVVPDSDTDYPEGGSGLVSTAGDYLRFALMLANGGSYRGARILQEDTVRQMRQLHIPSGVLAHEGIEGVGWGLGMAVTADADASLIPDRTGDFWWAGYLGTAFFVSPETGLVGVLLSQEEPGDYGDRPVAIYIAQALAFAGL